MGTTPSSDGRDRYQDPNLGAGGKVPHSGKDVLSSWWLGAGVPDLQTHHSSSAGRKFEGGSECHRCEMGREIGKLGDFSGKSPS